MEIVYKNKKIHKVCENYNEAKKIHGEQMAAKIHQRIDEICRICRTDDSI